jgi:hypothetical protein
VLAGPRGYLKHLGAEGLGVFDLDPLPHPDDQDAEEGSHPEFFLDEKDGLRYVQQAGFLTLKLRSEYILFPVDIVENGASIFILCWA